MPAAPRPIRRLMFLTRRIPPVPSMRLPLPAAQDRGRVWTSTSVRQPLGIRRKRGFVSTTSPPGRSSFCTPARTAAASPLPPPPPPVRPGSAPRRSSWSRTSTESVSASSAGSQGRGSGRSSRRSGYGRGCQRYIRTRSGMRVAQSYRVGRRTCGSCRNSCATSTCRRPRVIRNSRNRTCGRLSKRSTTRGSEKGLKKGFTSLPPGE